jgi:hypothetical protein
MITEMIKDLLYGNIFPLPQEKMEALLKEKGYMNHIDHLFHHSRYFKLSSGMVFLKDSLNSHKEVFFQEFADYIRNRISDNLLVKILSDAISNNIPDAILIEWLDISLERKLQVFDLLFSLFIKNRRTSSGLKKYFQDLIESYSLLAIYSVLIFRSQEENLEDFTAFITQLEIHEEVYRTHLLNLLTLPDIVSQKLENWVREYEASQCQIAAIFNEKYNIASRYSPVLLKRVIRNELKSFNTLYLLGRFEFDSLLEWILHLTEAEKQEPGRNLFKDLGLH